MSFRYYLPDEENNKVDYTTEANSLIIIGANGSGKSRLGAWIEDNTGDSTYRIGAQRSLTFGSFVQQKGYEQAVNLLTYGTENPNNNHVVRWGYEEGEIDYTSSLLNDYEYVLSALLALKNKQQEEYLDDCKKRESIGLVHNPIPTTVVDDLLEIWTSIFPQRELNFNDAKVIASYTGDDGKIEYKGRGMSDGERVALYLIAQTLCVPSGKTVIIDEPEVHLHRSIMNRLWAAIEAKRKDCLFIYITHDTQFASGHTQSEKLWVKEYDGKRWVIEAIGKSELPEQLLLDILGNRRPVLFVEGTMDSYDAKLYSKIYSDYYVVPCGGCSEVIARTKAMRKTPQLHHTQCFGIIDRDYRGQHEISKLQEQGIHVVAVAEVENLFVVQELLEIVNEIMGHSDKTKVDKIIHYVIDDRYAKQIDRQICESVVSEVKYQLNSCEISAESEEDARRSLNDLFAGIDYNEIEKTKRETFTSALSSRSYREILALFNCKKISTSIGHYYGIKNEEYVELVLRHIDGEQQDKIVAALKEYMPPGVPFEID